MSDIFLSYERSDRPRAALLAGALSDLQWDVWWDRSIPPGKTFDEVIEEQLANVGCVIVLWTSASVASRWVKTEAADGLERGILVPVLMDSVEIPLAFRRIQAADLTDWHAGESHAGFDDLVAAIAALLEARKPADSISVGPNGDHGSSDAQEDVDTGTRPIARDVEGIDPEMQAIYERGLRASEAGRWATAVGYLEEVDSSSSGTGEVAALLAEARQRVLSDELLREIDDAQAKGQWQDVLDGFSAMDRLGSSYFQDPEGWRTLAAERLEGLSRVERDASGLDSRVARPRGTNRSPLRMAVVGAGVIIVAVLAVILFAVYTGRSADPDPEASASTTAGPTSDSSLVGTTVISPPVTVGQERPEVSSPGTYEQSVLESGPIAFWPLVVDGSANFSDLAGAYGLVPLDAAGSAFAPTVVGGPGGLGALEFDGTAMRLQSTFNPASILGVDSWTVEFWMRSEVANSGGTDEQQTVLGGWSGEQARRWYLDVHGRNVCAGIGSFGEVCSSEEIVMPGTWQYVVLTYRATDGTARLFLDADEVTFDQSPWGLGEQLIDAPVALGAMWRDDSGEWQEYWSGGLTRVAVYDKVLEPEVIAAHFASEDGTE